MNPASRGEIWLVDLTRPRGGLTMTSFAKCEDVRSISASRLVDRLGKVSDQTMEFVEDRLRVLLGL